MLLSIAVNLLFCAMFVGELFNLLNKIITLVHLKHMLTLMGLSIGTLKIIDFPFVPNGKLIVLGVPKCRQIAVFDIK